jgi:CRISPR system Cascade subunit CasA
VRVVGDVLAPRKALNAYGDKITYENRHHLEPMSAWRLDEKNGAKVSIPTRHRSDRALWRGLTTILPQTEDALVIPPAIVRWIAVLNAAGVLDNLLVDIHAVGVEYGGTATSKKYDAMVDDKIILPTILLSDETGALAEQVKSAINVAEGAVSALGDLAKNIALALGRDPKGKELGAPQRRAISLAYSRLDTLFRVWILELCDLDQKHLMSVRAQWRSSVNKLIIELAGELISQAGPAALAGRVIKGKGQVDVGRAELCFRVRLREILFQASNPGEGSVL